LIFLWWSRQPLWRNLQHLMERYRRFFECLSIFRGNSLFVWFQVAYCRSAGQEGIIQVVPTLASCSAEEIMGACLPNQAAFYQLYFNSNHDTTRYVVNLRRCILSHFESFPVQ
jgi:hypothetical protein